MFDQEFGLVCNGLTLANTANDTDIIVVVDEESKYHGDDLVGRYIEFDSVDETNTIHGSIHNVGLSSKVFAIVRQVFPLGTKIISHKHVLMNMVNIKIVQHYVHQCHNKYRSIIIDNNVGKCFMFIDKLNHSRYVILIYTNNFTFKWYKPIRT